MQVYRGKFLYNSQKPIFANERVKTYQCMNTETKDQRFLVIQHLIQAPFVDPSPFVLQPIEAPTSDQPYSVYPIVQCCSNIKKINETDAMYVIKCLTQGKMKKPLYYLLAPQGVCVSQVEGLLPEKSPSLFQIAINMLDLPQSLAQVQKSVVSKTGYEICKALKDQQNPQQLLQKYEWKQNKKDKLVIADGQFWIFKGRRKEEGNFGDQYGLAWSSEHNLCRFRYIDLGKNGFEEEFYQDYIRKIGVYQKAAQNKLGLLNVYKYQKDSKGIKIFSEIPNQGSISDYLVAKSSQGKNLTQKTALPLLENFVDLLKSLKSTDLRSFGSLHIRNIFVHDGKIRIGDPLLITDLVEKKLRESKGGMDYFSPQLKQNILMPENLFKLDFEKMDVWFFGFLMHKILSKDVPLFQPTRKPILAKDKFSPGMLDLISRCLSLTPTNRPSLGDINFRELQKKVFLEQVQDQIESPKKQINLDQQRKQRISSRQSRNRKNDIQNSSSKKLRRSSSILEDEFQKLKSEQQPQEQENANQIIIPPSPKFRRFKLIIKLILVMVLYIFVFFKPFLWGSIDLLLVRGYYTTASVKLTSATGDVVSTSTILTNTPEYFMLNDISFEKMYNQLHCIANNFNPIHDPNYQLNTFIQSGGFLTLILMGWVGTIVICVTKSISLWRGGIGNNISGKNKPKYYLAYVFHQLSLAALLFAHFYVFQFFYFSLAKPCLGIVNFQGIEPFFDSSLYIFLGNTADYLRTVFACLGILGIVILFSSCFYAWGPKLDTKHIVSIPSIIFRVLPYLLFILLCRVGVFFILNPTAINDQNKILQSLVSGSFVGVLGVIPEIFILIVVIFQILYQVLMNWIQKKVMESNKLSRLFSFRKKGGESVSKLSRMQSLNEMSLDNSKNDLIMEE